MDEIIYSNIQAKDPICGMKPVDWGGDATIPSYSHCGEVNRCISYYPFGPTDYVWAFSYGIGELDGGNCVCGSYDCPKSSETCNAANYGKWLVSFCQT
jgi:hypothetical protein